MVIGLNGRIPLNTAGNLAGSVGTGTHAAHLGNSVSEIDPTYGLQNGFHATASRRRPVNTSPAYGVPRRHTGRTPRSTTSRTDVRLTQLRNLLAGTRPPDPAPQPCRHRPQPTRHDVGLLNGDDNFVSVYRSVIFTSCPTASPTRRQSRSDPQHHRHLASRDSTRRWPGGGRIRQSVSGLHRSIPTRRRRRRRLNLCPHHLRQPGRAGYSVDISDISSRYDPATRPTTITTRSTPIRHRPVTRPAGRGRRSDVLRRGRGSPAAGRSDASVGDPGRHQRHRQRAHWSTASTGSSPAERGCRRLWPRRILQLLPAPRTHRAINVNTRR